jgi:hypothetical protein
MKTYMEPLPVHERFTDPHTKINLPVTKSRLVKISPLRRAGSSSNVRANTVRGETGVNSLVQALQQSMSNYDYQEGI